MLHLFEHSGVWSRGQSEGRLWGLSSWFGQRCYGRRKLSGVHIRSHQCGEDVHFRRWENLSICPFIVSMSLLLLEGFCVSFIFSVHVSLTVESHLSVSPSGPDNDSGLLPRSLSVIFNSIEGHIYGRSDLKPLRCRDFSRLTAEQEAAENRSKKNLLRLLKEVRQAERQTNKVWDTQSCWWCLVIV